MLMIEVHLSASKEALRQKNPSRNCTSRFCNKERRVFAEADIELSILVSEEAG